MSQKKKSVVIIDDEQLARDIIFEYLQDVEDFEVVGQCSNGFEGVKMIQDLKPDLIFLDVKMPKITGFEMLELIDDPPFVIFSTAFDEFAIEAFDQSAIDYLLKPYSEERFGTALEKARGKFQSSGQAQKQLKEFIKSSSGSDTLERIVVKSGSKINIIPISDIVHIEAMDDYVRINTVQGSYLKQNTMKYYEENLPQSEFVRTHRSHIVSISHISKLEPMGKESYVVILHNSKSLSVSKSGYLRLREVLKF